MNRPNAERDNPPFLMPLPRVEDLPLAKDGYDRARVADSFDVFERQLGNLQARISVLEAAGSAGNPGAHAVRMDALNLIRGAAEYAETLERDAVDAVARQLEHARSDMQGAMANLAERLSELARRRDEFERERAELLAEARRIGEDMRAAAQRDADELLRDAELRASRLIEKARHDATELTNSARVEVERTLDWARRHSETMLNRGREGAERLLAAAGADPTTLAEVTGALIDEVERDDPTDEPEPPER
jgi:F0F1-type ATP synthase membrane subunit b/b'